MKFTTLGANEDVAALARRLYNPPTPQAQRDAESALLRANPALADATARTPGAILIVPDVAGATPTAEARTEGGLVVPILQAARDQLGAVAAALRGTVDERRATVRATLDEVGSTRIRDLVRDDPTLQGAINDVASQAGAESGEIDALDALQQQVIAELGQDLDDLIRSVGGQPSPPPPTPPSGPTSPGPTRGPVPSPAPPIPTQPTPTQPTPTQPTPTTPTRPTQPTPVPTGPVQPSPTVPSPAPPAPTPPSPIPTRPTQPAPVPGPATPTPTGPVRPTPVTPVQPGTTISGTAQPRTPPGAITPIARRGKRKPKRPSS